MKTPETQCPLTRQPCMNDCESFDTCLHTKSGKKLFRTTLRNLLFDIMSVQREKRDGLDQVDRSLIDDLERICGWIKAVDKEQSHE